MLTKRLLWHDWLSSRIAFTSSGEGLEREEKGMEEVGMTDLQFKSFLKQLIRNIEQAKDEKTEAAKDEKLREILNDLKADLES